MVAITVTIIATIDIYKEEGAVNIGLSAATLFFGFLFGSGISLALILLNNRIRSSGKPIERDNQLATDNYQTKKNILFLRLCEYEQTFEIELGGIKLRGLLNHFRPNDRLKVISGISDIKGVTDKIDLNSIEIRDVKSLIDLFEQNRIEKIDNIRIDLLDLGLLIGITEKQFPTLIFSKDSFEKDLIQHTIKALIENNVGSFDSEIDIWTILTESIRKYILFSKTDLLEFENFQDLQNFIEE